MLATIKFTKQFLAKLEDIFSESEYSLRYERGNFQSGYCLLNEEKVAIVNKYFPLDGRISSLIEILRSININPEKLSERNRKLYQEISQTELKV
ncbi:MAG: hypothetical protein O2887_10675 [Bacteroidetes bacterium]|nr:hypothetical protein [Bacteroidota bacterium]MDA1120934.1 hypothetical protein [Bacteroidota bacterium]